MDLINFCHELPKIELHAHLNGSLSRSTMVALRRYYADAGLKDTSNVFFDEFEVGAGDKRNLSDSFQVFAIAHSLTTTPEALALATKLTLQEFHDDGCCYIELRSTPRDTEHMTKLQYIETLVRTIRESSARLVMICRLIVSINRSSSPQDADEIANLAIDSFKKHPDIVVGIELSGNPTIGKFLNFKSAFIKAREAGLKITLHCGEVCNESEIADMLDFKPERIGHGIHIHPKMGGTDKNWETLCQSKIPVEVCLTSNVNTKSVTDYSYHHFMELYKANVPVIICTDDKGVFATSLTQEYFLCAETFELSNAQLAKLALHACPYIFAKEMCEILENKILDFMKTKDINVL